MSRFTLKQVNFRDFRKTGRTWFQQKFIFSAYFRLQENEASSSGIAIFAPSILPLTLT